MPDIQGLARLLIGEDPAAQWQEYGEQDRQRLVHVAEAEGVAPLVYRRLQKTGFPPDLPGSVEARLQRSYYSSVARSQVLENELERAGGIFKAQGIPYLPLKGAALAWTLYPEPALRPMSDLDLLVAPADLRRALRALNRAGFTTQKITDHAVLVGSRPIDCAIELHWTLPGGVPIPTAYFQSSNLQPATDLIYLCAHLGLKHYGQERLIWLYDIYLLLQRRGGELDWGMLWAQADALGYAPSVAYVLSLAFERFGLAMPGLPGEIADAINRQALPQPVPVSQATRRAWQALSLPARLRLLPGLLFPSPGYMQWKYRPQPGWLWPFYYPKRWVEILRPGRA